MTLSRITNPPRRLLQLALAALFATAILSATVAGPASAAVSTDRVVSYQAGSSMKIVDDEWPWASETKTENLSNQGSYRTSLASPFAYGGTNDCAGDEVRVYLDSKAEQSTIYTGWVYMTFTARLYEGASCFSNDLDGTKTVSFWIAPDTKGSQTFTVRNDDEGGDYATIKLNLINQAG